MSAEVDALWRIRSPSGQKKNTSQMQTKPFVISLIILVLSVSSISAVSLRGNPVVVRTNLENIPMEIAGFAAVEDSFSKGVYDELNADKNVYRHYVNEQGDHVDVYIGYYGTAKGGRTGHNPYACLPGGGWAILKTGELRLRPYYCTKGVHVNYILSCKGDTYEVVIHWYQSAGDEVLATGFEQNMQRFMGRILRNRNDGAFVRLSAATSQGLIRQTTQTLAFFAVKILDLLPKYWPEEK